MNTCRTAERGTEEIKSDHGLECGRGGEFVGGKAVGALTRAVSVGGWCSAVGWAGEERGQAGVVCVLAGEEGFTLFSWRQQAGLRRETGQRV